MNKIIGVYQIVHKSANMVYIGQSIDIFRRMSQHYGQLRRGTHRCPRLQNAYTKYGLEDFTWFILEECSLDKMTNREQFWLDHTDDKYNTAPAADSCRGVRWSMAAR